MKPACRSNDDAALSEIRKAIGLDPTPTCPGKRDLLQNKQQKYGTVIETKEVYRSIEIICEDDEKVLLGLDH